MNPAILVKNIKFLADTGLWKSWISSKKIVYIQLFIHQPPGQDSNITYERLSEETGISVIQIRRAMAELLKEGYVNDIARYTHGKVYQVVELSLDLQK
jgi:predicted transcriptional regulator